VLENVMALALKLGVIPELIATAGVNVKAAVAVILLGHEVIEPDDRVKFVRLNVFAKLEAPLRVRLPVPLIESENWIAPPEEVKIGELSIVISGTIDMFPVVEIFGQLTTAPEFKLKLERFVPLPTAPAKVIEPPFKTSDPGPSTVELNTVLPVKVAVCPELIVTAGVKSIDRAMRLLGHELIEPDVKLKEERVALLPTASPKLTGPFKTTPPGPSNVLANEIGLPVKLGVTPELIETAEEKVNAPVVSILEDHELIEPDVKVKL
jgi:hypothetical protein